MSQGGGGEGGEGGESSEGGSEGESSEGGGESSEGESSPNTPNPTPQPTPNPATGQTPQPTPFPTSPPECYYPNVTQSCCSGGYYIFNTADGPPQCYDGNDLCGSESLVGNATILDSNATWDSTEETCYCDYRLESCSPDEVITSCTEEKTWVCCATFDTDYGDIEINNCTADDPRECEYSMTYKCAAPQTQDLCDVDSVGYNIDTEDTYSYYGVSEPYLEWWYDEDNESFDGECWCRYEYYLKTCPSPTGHPTIMPTDDTATTPSADPFAVFEGTFVITTDGDNIDCGYDWDKYVFSQILETATVLTVNQDTCQVVSGNYYIEISITVEWQTQDEYVADSSALSRLEDDTYDEMIEYADEGIISATLQSEDLDCEQCYILSDSIMNKPNLSNKLLLMGCIIIMNIMYFYTY